MVQFVPVIFPPVQFPICPVFPATEVTKIAAEPVANVPEVAEIVPSIVNGRSVVTPVALSIVMVAPEAHKISQRPP